MSGLPLLRQMKDILARKPVPQIGPRLLDFWASWCAECVKMDPIIAGLKKKGYDVQKIDVDMDVFTADEYEVGELPMFIVLSKDGTESGRIIGKATESTLLQMLRNAK